MNAAPSISGMTIAYRALASGYPLAESIRSMLPVCDEVVVNVGPSEDGTLDAVLGIGSGKIRVIQENWDLGVREKGLTFSRETNRALDNCRGDWVLYLQADEILHERDLAPLAELVRELHPRRRIDGATFKYLHFYGSPDYVQDHFRKWYPRAVRLIRNDPAIRSTGDALKFRRMIRGRPRRLRAYRSGLTIYHYGWARPPEVMVAKQRQFERFYREEETWRRRAEAMAPENIYSDLGNLRRFDGTHPAVMSERIKAATWRFDPHLERQWPRWIRLAIIFAWYPLMRGWVKTAARIREAWRGFRRIDRPGGDG